MGKARGTGRCRETPRPAPATGRAPPGRRGRRVGARERGGGHSGEARRRAARLRRGRGGARGPGAVHRRRRAPGQPRAVATEGDTGRAGHAQHTGVGGSGRGGRGGRQRGRGGGRGLGRVDPVRRRRRRARAREPARRGHRTVRVGTRLRVPVCRDARRRGRARGPAPRRGDRPCLPDAAGPGALPPQACACWRPGGYAPPSSRRWRPRPSAPASSVRADSRGPAGSRGPSLGLPPWAPRCHLCSLLPHFPHCPQ